MNSATSLIPMEAMQSPVDEDSLILAVDDQPANLLALEHVLRGVNARVVKTKSGEEALAALLKQRFALAILDVQMPGMDGYELAEIILGDPSTSRTPIIFVSAAYSDEMHQFKGYDTGAVDYLVKPYRPEVLVSKVKVFLELARHERNLESLVADRTAALATSERRYRTLFQTMSQGVVYQDQTGRIIDANPAAALILGVPREQLLQRDSSAPQWEAISEDGSPLPADQHPAMVALRQRRPVYDFVMGIRRPASRERVWITVSAIPQSRGDKNIPEHVYTTFSDITIRRAAERQIENSERALRAVFDATHDGMLALVVQTLEIRLTNEALARLLGIENPVPPGTSLRSLLTQKQIAELISEPADQSPGSPRTVELVISRADGTNVVAEARVTPVVLDGQPCLLAVLRDLTQRRQEETERMRLEQELFQAQKMESIGMLAGGVAHDFNNFLMVISGNIDLVQLSEGVDAEMCQYLQEVRQAVDCSAELTRKLLAFGRKQPMVRVPMDLNHVCQAADKLLRRIIGEDIELRLDLAAHLGTVCGDPGQIEQVIMNLAANARDAMTSGGCLICETANIEVDDALLGRHPDLRRGAYVRLRVSDTGCGMDCATIARIFEPFYTTKVEGKGTGLGLATVYGIVKQSDGFVFVDSEVGKGTSFEIYLPRVFDLDPVAMPVVNAAHQRMGGTETILVVDDAAPVRNLAARILEHAGYRVLAASNGVDAVKVIETFQESIHLVLTDVVMPRMGGEELSNRVRGARPDTGVLFMSGYAGELLRRGKALVSADNLISKPFRVEELLRKVRLTLEEQTRDRFGVNSNISVNIDYP